MIPIRIKVILLAALAVLSLTALLLNEYAERNRTLTEADEALKAIRTVSAFSQLVHCLQRERGLTAIVLVDANAPARQDLLRQRDCSLDARSTVQQLAPTAAAPFNGELETFRRKLDAGDANWDDVRGFYTAKIDSLLNHMAILLVELSFEATINHQLHAVISLAQAREHMGLVRANVGRVLERGQPTDAERLDIHVRSRQFLRAMQAYEAHATRSRAPVEEDSRVQTQITSLFSIINSIERQTPKLQSEDWWQQATALIDRLKAWEDEHILALNQSSEASVGHARDALRKTMTITISLFILIMVLAVLTIKRILNALGILARVLHRIQQTHDFGLRVQTRGRDEFGELSLSINDLLDFTDHIVKEKELLAATDPLTGLPNRRQLTHIANAEAHRSQRYRTPLSLILCDIDHFKRINDEFGHATGDEVLQGFARVVHEHIRESDVVGRWGGEEFVILAPQTSLAQATELAEHLRRTLSKFSIAGVPNLPCSFGVAQLEPEERVGPLFARADAALYKAKNGGRNRVCCDEGSTAPE